jgi:methionine-rich copper-binding protein CopC
MLRLTVFVLAAATVFVAATAAFAHAEPARVEPGEGAVLAGSPPYVVIEMSQEMARREGANAIDVFDASGKEVTTADAVVDNADRQKLSVALPSDLPTGVYTVRWKTVSADDGDPADGQLSFTVDPNRVPDPGKSDLRATAAASTTGKPAAAVPIEAPAAGDGGTSWVLVTAVAVGMFVLGAGGTFVMVRRPR